MRLRGTEGGCWAGVAPLWVPSPGVGASSFPVRAPAVCPSQGCWASCVVPSVSLPPGSALWSGWPYVILITSGVDSNLKLKAGKLIVVLGDLC